MGTWGELFPAGAIVKSLVGLGTLTTPGTTLRTDVAKQLSANATDYYSNGPGFSSSTVSCPVGTPIFAYELIDDFCPSPTDGDCCGDHSSTQRIGQEGRLYNINWACLILTDSPINCADASTHNCKDLACASTPECKGKVKNKCNGCCGGFNGPGKGNPPTPSADLTKLLYGDGSQCACKSNQAKGDSGQTSTPPPPTPCEKQDGEPIGVNSGFLTDSRTDIALPGRMVAGIIPYFHSDLEYMGPLGFGWSSVLSVRLSHWPDSTWSLRDQWGQREDFSSTGTNTSQRFYAGNLDLSSPDSVRIRIDRDHIFAFDRTDGVLLRIRDDRGAQVNFQYETANLTGSQPGKGASRRQYPIKGVSTYAVPRGLRGTIALDYRVTAILDGDNSARMLSVTYDTTGHVQSISDPTGKSVSYQYDLLGNLQRVTFPDGTLRRYFWTNPANIHRLMAFDAKIIGPSLASDTTVLTRNTWDAIGRVTSQTWQGATFTFQRAPYGSTASISPTSDTTTTWARITSLTRVEPDGLGGTRTTTKAYADSVQNLTPAGGVATWTGRTEQVIQTVNGVSDTTIIRYRSDNSIASEIRPDGTTVTWNAAGNVQTVVESPRTGHGPVRTTAITLDAAGHTTRQVVSIPGVPADIHNWTWVNGNLTSDCLGDGTAQLCTQRQYDAQNRLWKVTDPTGAVTTYVYLTTTAMQPDSTTFADGIGERYTRDVLGRILSTRNQFGQIATTAFDAVGHDTLSCAYDGSCVRHVYNGPNLVRLDEGGILVSGQFSSPLRVSSYVVDGYGRRTQEWLQSGTRQVLKRKSVLDAFGNVVEVRDNPDSTNTDTTKWRLVERNLYDGRNHLVQHRTFPNGAGFDSLVTKYGDDIPGHVVADTDARTAVSHHSYDAWGNVLADTNAAGNVTRHGFDASNRVLSDTNALGQVTSHTYDAQGHEVQRIGYRQDTLIWIYANGLLAKERSAEGNWTTYAYDSRNRLISVTRKVGDSALIADANDITTNYSYDPLGNRIRETVAGAVQHRYAVDALGRVLADTNALNQVITSSYDRLGRQLRQISVAGDTLATDYDAQCRVAIRRLLSPGKAADTLSVTRFDDANRPVLERIPGSGAVAKLYDGTDYIKQSTDSVGIVTAFTQDRTRGDSLVSVAGKTARKTVRDAAGRVIQQWDERGNRVAMAYDHLDRLTTLIDNENNVTTFTYVDSTGGWRRTTTYPDSKTESHLYDREGRLRRFVDGRGFQTVYRYDSLSRLVGVDYLTSTGATAATSLALSYDNLGRLAKASQGTTTVDSATYDNLGRTLTSLQTVAGTVYTLGYAYADAARTRTITLPDGATVKQKWTPRGLLDSLWSGSRLLARFGYSSGLETSRTLGNGISLAQGFDAGGRLTSMAYSLAGQTLPNLGFAFDPSGNKNLIRRNHSTATSEAIGYTNDNQVSAWNKGTADASGAIASPTTSQSWTLDSRGNWSSWTQSGTAQTRTHSTANELTAMGATALTWDAAGNLTSDGTLAYVFGARGTLDTVKQGATVSGIYGTDPLGRRALKTVGSLKTISVWDGWSCVWQKVTGSGTDTTKAFTYGNSIDREVSMIRKWGSSSDTVYAIQGNNENTEALTDRTGAVVERYEYTPYGKPTVYTGAGTDGKWFTADDVAGTVSAKGNNLLFQGRELDGESGNFYGSMPF
jgi:YD repeat-containing protein